jgi:DNA-directed RNA polymerase subunit N (RpoN/RPB10)
MQNANLWRISGDFWDNWPALEAQFHLCRRWAPYVRPGHWPDADMLPLGRLGGPGARNCGLTKDEQIALMTLWAIFRSPLMFGGDLPGNDEFTLSLITNDEVLAVNRNSTANRPLFTRNDLIAWTADVPGSADKYVAMFNIGKDEEPAEISVVFEDLGLKPKCGVRDLWTHKDLGEFEKEFTQKIPRHGGGLYRVSPRREGSTEMGVRNEREASVVSGATAETQPVNRRYRLAYKLARGSENWGSSMAKRITDAMDAAVALYNEQGEFDKAVTANYNPITPTADASYSGWINFGSAISKRVALHEIAHTLGIGQHSNWGRLIKDGKWTGKKALDQLREFDGPDAVLRADRMHFWPYGLNYDSESSPENDRRHVKMVAALRLDMGIVNGE